MPAPSSRQLVGRRGSEGKPASIDAAGRVQWPCRADPAIACTGYVLLTTLEDPNHLELHHLSCILWATSEGDTKLELLHVAKCDEPWPGSDQIRCNEPPDHGGPHVRDLGGDVYSWSFQPAPKRRRAEQKETPVDRVTPGDVLGSYSGSEFKSPITALSTRSVAASKMNSALVTVRRQRMRVRAAGRGSSRLARIEAMPSATNSSPNATSRSAASSSSGSQRGSRPPRWPLPARPQGPRRRGNRDDPAQLPLSGWWRLLRGGRATSPQGLSGLCAVSWARNLPFGRRPLRSPSRYFALKKSM